MVGMAKAKSTKAYRLRAATQDDLKAIMGLYNWAVNQTFATIDSEPVDAEEARAWWEMHGKRSKLLVSVDDTGVIGWARLLPWKQRGFDVVEMPRLRRPRAPWTGDRDGSPQRADQGSPRAGLPDDRRQHRQRQPGWPGPLLQAGF